MTHTEHFAPGRLTPLREVLLRRGLTQRKLAEALRTRGHKAPDTHINRIVGGYVPGPAYRRDIAEIVGEREETLWG